MTKPTTTIPLDHRITMNLQMKRINLLDSALATALDALNDIATKENDLEGAKAYAAGAVAGIRATMKGYL